MGHSEEDLQSAIRDLESGVYTSQRLACKGWGVPRATLQQRLKGRQTRAKSHQQQQRLDPDLEEFLVGWILEENAQAEPPSHAQVRDMASLMLKFNGDHEPLGRRWVPTFIKRHPQVSGIIGRSIKAAQAEAYNHARTEDLSPRATRSGRTARAPRGISPCNSNVAASSPQLIGLSGTEIIEDFFREQQRVLQTEPLSRDARRLVHKLGKAVSRAWARVDKLESENQRLRAELQDLKDTNAAEEAAEQDFQSMCIERQL